MAGMDIFPFSVHVFAFYLPLSYLYVQQPEVALVTVRFYEISCTIDGALNDTTKLTCVTAAQYYVVLVIEHGYNLP